LDWTGPDEYGVVERGNVARTGDFRRRHYDEDQVPQCSGGNGPARKSAFDPCIFEKTGGEEFSRFNRKAQCGGKAAGKTLPEFAPADFGLRLGPARRKKGGPRGMAPGETVQATWG